jgi:hypothetical protein
MVRNGLDIDNAATILMRLHGDKAGSVAAKRADLRMLGGDIYGMAAWKLVGDTIERLQRINQNGEHGSEFGAFQ